MTTGPEPIAPVWTRGAAIRPVPRFAVVNGSSLRDVEEELAETEGPGGASMDGAFERFEASQPEVCARIQDVLERPLDETALALGYFLSVAVWLAFEREFADRLAEVSRDAWRATVDALALEEDLRRGNPAEPLDLDDILAMQQPDVVAFVHDHIDAALDSTSSLGDDGAADDQGSREVDVDDVHLVYRTILLETLALSHAVAPGPDEASQELQA